MTLKNLYAAVLSSAILIAVPAAALAGTPAGDDGQGDKTDTMKGGTVVAKNGADDPAGDVSGEGAGHPVTLAKNGADDPAGDVSGEGAGHPVMLAKNGADDPAGDVSGEGAGHPVMLAKNGADDPAGDVSGEGAGHPVA